MTKSNILTTILMPLCLLFSGLFFSACDNSGMEITKISIDNYQQEVAKSSVYDYASIAVKATRVDTSIIAVPHDDSLSFSVIDTSTVGEKDLIATLKVGEKSYVSETKKVMVYGELTTLSVKAGTYKNKVIQNTDFDANNITLILSYEGGLRKEVAFQDLVGATISPISTADVGTQTVDITYLGKIASFSFEIVKEGVVSIAFDATTTPTEINKGEELNLDAIVIYCTKTDNSIVPLSRNEYSFNSFNSSLAGSQDLVVTYLANTALQATQTIKVFGDVVEIEVVSGINTEIAVGQEYDLSNLVLKIIYEGNLKKTLNFAQLSVDSKFGYNEISTQFAGVQTLTLIYGAQTIAIDIQVVESYIVLGFTQATSYANYLENSVKQNTYNATGSSGVKGFTDINNIYMVGYDNDFIYTPILQVFDSPNVANLTEFMAEIEVYLVEENEIKLDISNNEYVDVNTFTHHFAFNENASGKTFRIEMYPSNIASSSAISKVSATVKVVEGYNVYTASDLAVIDNVNAGGKWTELKQANGLLDVTANAIILHNDITIQAKDVPSIHFWTSEEVNGASDIGLGVIGSLKDRDIGHNSLVADAQNADLASGQVLGNVYRRALKEGESFTIEGNYFQLDASSFPLIVRESGDSVAIAGNPIVSHTSLLGVEYEVSNVLGNASLNINNISLFGNSNKVEEYKYSGGVMFLKSRNVKVNLYNNLSQSWYMSYMFRGPDSEQVQYSAESDILVNMDKVNAFDAYNCLLYLQGTGKVAIQDCVMIGAGGPVMIVDHCKPRNTLATEGYPCNIITSNSVLESFVAGTEGWFVSMNATETASQIKSIDRLIQGFTAQAMQLGLGSTLKTILNNDKLNIVAVFKSDNTAAMEDETTASTFYDTEFGNFMMAMDRYIQVISANAGANVIETFNNSRFIPTDSAPYFGMYGYGSAENTYTLSTYSDETFGAYLSYLSSASKYIAGYLYNNMGVLLGLMDTAEYSYATE